MTLCHLRQLSKAAVRWHNCEEQSLMEEGLQDEDLCEVSECVCACVRVRACECVCVVWCVCARL